MTFSCAREAWGGPGLKGEPAVAMDARSFVSPVDAPIGKFPYSGFETDKPGPLTPCSAMAVPI